ncbi:MAG: squalene synthase HpnC [Pseudomonadota bacterium]|jgi:squalene synthase HpnC
MSVNHYENFPVASILLPRYLRQPMATIYHFARSADDIADEGDALPEERLSALGAYRAELDILAAGQPSIHPLFQALAKTMADFDLPLSPFYELISAFEQDVQQTRYADFQELLAYCRRSANPVGQLVLHLTGQASQQNLKYSDHICTALQLINFWQDVAIDWNKGRVYLPQSELALFDLTETEIAAFANGDTCSPRWRDLMRFQTKRARQLMCAGAPLIEVLPGRLKWEIQLTVMGGLRILQKLDQCGGDIFRKRPVLTLRDWCGMLVKLARSHFKRDRRWLR